MAVADTTQRFLRSTGAAVFSQAWRVLVTLGVMILCRRLIPAAEYGLWNWALPLFFIFGALRDLGLVYHVIRLRPRPYGNLLALEAVWGGILVVATWLGAPALVAFGLAEPIPQAVGVVRALGLFLFFEGLSSVPRVWFEGELEVGRTVLPEILRNLAMALVTIGLALAGYGVWALVAGQVVAAALYAALLWRRAWGKIPLLYLRGQTLSLVRASLPLAAIWLLALLTRFIDPLIIGKRFSTEVVANYGIAYKNSFRMTEIVVPALTRSLYPALVAFASDLKRLFQTYALTTVVMMGLEVPIAYFLFVNADLAVWLIGGGQYVEMAPPFLRVLAFAPLIDPFGRLGGEVIKARHLDRLWVISVAVTLAVFVVLGIAFTGLFGPIGMAWAKLLPLGGLIMAWALYRLSPAGFRRLTADLAYVYLVPAPFFAALYLLPDGRPWLRFAASFLSLGIAFALLGRRFGPDFLRYLRAARSPERHQAIERSTPSSSAT